MGKSNLESLKKIVSDYKKYMLDFMIACHKAQSVATSLSSKTLENRHLIWIHMRYLHVQSCTQILHWISGKMSFVREELEDNKGVIRISKAKKDRQYNGQKKKHKRTNNDLLNIQIKLKIE